MYDVMMMIIIDDDACFVHYYVLINWHKSRHKMSLYKKKLN